MFVSKKLPVLLSNLRAFVQLYASSFNIFILQLQICDVFYNSSFFQCVPLLHDDEEMQNHFHPTSFYLRTFDA